MKIACIVCVSSSLKQQQQKNSPQISFDSTKTSKHISKQKNKNRIHVCVLVKNKRFLLWRDTGRSDASMMCSEHASHNVDRFSFSLLSSLLLLNGYIMGMQGNNEISYLFTHWFIPLITLLTLVFILFWFYYFFWIHVNGDELMIEFLRVRDLHKQIWIL